MTYTFKLARRLALCRFGWLAVVAVVGSACSSAEPPTSVSGTTGQLAAGRPAPTATSETDNTRPAKRRHKADHSSVTAVPPQRTLMAVVVTPFVDTLPEGASVTFTASGRWSDGTTMPLVVAWSATGGAMNAGGRYTAGMIPGQYHVVCADTSGTVADTASVTITAPQVAQVVLMPATTTVAPGGTQQFTAYGRSGNGDTMALPVTFVASGGTIAASGLYTAGPTPGTYRVLATYEAGIKADTSIVAVTSLPPTALVLLTQPSGAASAVPFTQQPVIELRNAQNQPIQRSGIVIIASKASGTGTLGGTLSSITNAQGRASFSGLQITGIGPHTITFASNGLKSVTSTTLMLVAPTLRSLASSRGFTIGAAVRDTAFRDDAQYRQTLATQYNSIVPEDATDFLPIHPGLGRYNFAAADALLNFAQANAMAFHGHHLVWYAWIPTWITNGGYTNDQLREILKDHITTVVSRYRGKAASWDVVNEVIDNEGCFTNHCGLRSSFWLNHLGPEYIDSAFIWAHRADPAAKLYLNEFRTETIMNKSDVVLALVRGLKARGIPIDGVGFQVHILPQFISPPTSEQMQTNLQRFANAGFDIRITEMDVAIPDAGGAADLAAQAVVYDNVLKACLAVSRCKELTTWGFTDRFNWVPKSFPGYGRALPFDSNYRPKPAFTALVTRLGQP